MQNMISWKKLKLIPREASNSKFYMMRQMTTATKKDKKEISWKRSKSQISKKW